MQNNAIFQEKKYTIKLFGAFKIAYFYFSVQGGNLEFVDFKVLQHSSPNYFFFERYVGNPDLIPIRTDEFGFLVRLLHKISSNINDRYGDSINDVYQRRSPAGAICRQVSYILGNKW